MTTKTPVLGCGSIIMLRSVFVLLHLLYQGLQARRDARVRFLALQVELLRGKLGRNRVILSSKERGRLLAIGCQLGHDVKDVLGIVTHQTYRRWLREERVGRAQGRAGRPRVSAVRRRLILRFVRENVTWGYRRIVGELYKLHLPVGRSTVRRILQSEGIFPEPAGRRPRPTDIPLAEVPSPAPEHARGL
jgi:putative transposase